jgi:hypothetical protein
VKFQVLDIIPHLKNPVTGEIVSTADRLNQVVRTAQLAEELGYDSFSVGERHAGEFISSSPTTVLAAIAAVTDSIRLHTGVTVVYEAPGELHFRLAGRDLVLTAFNGHEPGTLFVPFTDATSGRTTYAANRSLGIGAPAADGTVTLDFNRAVNLPCAYTDLATCPLPPSENRLPVAVEAGEQIPYERQDAS